MVQGALGGPSVFVSLFFSSGEPCVQRSPKAMVSDQGSVHMVQEFAHTVVGRTDGRTDRSVTVLLSSERESCPMWPCVFNDLATAGDGGQLVLQREKG